MERNPWKKALTGALTLSLTLSLFTPAALAAQPAPDPDSSTVAVAAPADDSLYAASNPSETNPTNPDATGGDDDALPSESGDPGQENPPDGNQDPQEPGDSNPDSQPPGDDNPDSQTPEGENPGDDNPSEQVPGEEIPGEENPGEENPGQENPPVEPQPVDNPRRLTPAAPALTAGSLALEQSHVAYMIGMGDGTFHPDQAMTRAEAIQLLARLVTTSPAVTYALPYDDVAAGSWYYDATVKLYNLGLLREGGSLLPDETITRAEFTDLFVLAGQASGLLETPDIQTQEESLFPDVPADHWAAPRINAAFRAGWITGYPDGNFGTDDGMTRAEVSTIVNRIMKRTGDAELGPWLLAIGLFKDVSPKHWAAGYIAESAIAHTPATTNPETWTNVQVPSIKTDAAMGFHTYDGKLYYVNRYHEVMMNAPLGAFQADQYGVMTQKATSHQLEWVPYISQIDNIYAWVGCEPVSALMGLKARGFAWDTDVRTFLDKLPTTKSDPEKGFVGSPYKPDKTKKTRTTIYPAKLAEYCNTYTNGYNICADFRGASIEELQRELLAGNPVVCYMTLWWDKPYYRNYNIEGQTQRLVSNNHALLVYGYDPEKGYLCSDPYNYYNRGKVHQYWEPAKVFEPIWNERKVGMVLRW